MATLDMFTDLDATAQAELVRRKEVKSIELVDAAIERIERINPMINAVVTPIYEQARSAAKDHLPEGPFTGVPFLLKDIFAAYEGVRMTSGSAFLRDHVSDHDSEIVARYKRAGLIILGKANTSEFGLIPTTEPRLFGPTCNPWDTSRTAGGSSGGSAAAVASGMVSIAHGNAGGGSIRIPASCCGIFGLKPTRARTPAGPDFGDFLGGLTINHVLTRSVRDSAALLDATAGPDVGDPYWAPPPERPFVQEVGANPGKLRIAFTVESPTGAPVTPDCFQAVKEAAALCSELGHEMEEATPAIIAEMVIQPFITVWAAGAAMAVDGLALLSGRIATPDEFEPLTWALCEKGRSHNSAEYLIAVTMLQRVAREIAHFFIDFDLWLSPTLTEPPVTLGTFESPPENPMKGFDQAVLYCPFTPIANFTGQPAMSVPLYWTADGLPVGTHLMGRFGDEATLFRLAAQLEEAQPWANRRPPLSA
ncbi:MAG: amidase [Dehalococcoidia bacterium]|nr:MAG: amidase [Dehalococcoidia bacterium]